MTDSQLLERFLQHNHAGAFEDLVRSHGPMVLKVCQRILMDHHDAEEAFQATFLVLARKARSLLRRRSVAGWLYEVACRTALGARRDRAIRRKREQQMEPLPDRIAESAEGMTDIARVLDQELSRLPEKYRLPVVLCDLEGRRLQDVAAQLGCPLGTLSGRLTRAREMLRQRLIRQGVTVSCGALAMALSQQAASASVPAALVSSTVQVVNVFTISSVATAGAISPHVAALTEGVLKIMFYAQLKQMALVATIVVFAGIGAGGLIQMSAAEPTAKPQKVEDVLEKLQGDWKAVSVEEKGKTVPEERVKAKQPRMTFTDQEFRMTSFNEDQEVVLKAAWKVDVTKQPFEIDLSDLTDNVGETSLKEMAIIGIFKFEGEKLKLRIRGNQDSEKKPVQRPTKFDTTKDRAADDTLVDVTWTLERVKK